MVQTSLSRIVHSVQQLNDPIIFNKMLEINEWNSGWKKMTLNKLIEMMPQQISAIIKAKGLNI